MRSLDMMNHVATHRVPGLDDSALFRIRAEFAEMPGLKLTLAQAVRLFQLERSRCQQVLGALVDSGQLVVRGDTFLRTPPA